LTSRSISYTCVVVRIMTPRTLIGTTISKRSCCHHHVQVEIQCASANPSKCYVPAVTELWELNNAVCFTMKRDSKTSFLQQQQKKLQFVEFFKLCMTNIKPGKWIVAVWTASCICVYLTFMCPCIANIFSEYNQQEATFLNLFIPVRRSTYFRRFFRPSSGAQNCTYRVRYLSDQYCYLLLAGKTAWNKYSVLQE